MSLPLAIIWIGVISSFCFLGAYYARRYGKPDALIAFYVLLLVVANISISKIVEFDLGFGKFFAPAATLIFAVTFLITDIVNERFGRKETQKMILIGFFSQIALVIFSYLIVHSDPAPFFLNQRSFEDLLSNVPRIVLASLAAFIISENFDAYIFHWFRKITNGKHLWARNVFSSMPAMFLDSVIVLTLAFYGQMPLMPLIIGLTLTKWLVGIVDIPFMYLSRFVMGTNKTNNPPFPHSGI